MARKKTSAHRFLYFDLNHTGTDEDFHYIDIAACLSAVNRRLYRQGRMYHVANVSIHDSDADCEVRFATAPNTWVTHKAWQNSFDAWREQIEGVLEEMPEQAPDPEGKWSDFKIYLNNNHKDDADKPKPIDVEGNNVLMYGTGSENEWFYTAVQTRVDETAYTNLNFVLLGNHNIASNGEIGVIKGLEDVWRYQSYDPELPPAFDESPIIGMSTSGRSPKESEVLDAIMDENDQPPYAYNHFVGTNDNLRYPLTVREGSITTTQNEMTYLGGFPVPCGLLLVETKSGTDGNVIGVSIELAPGNYKGVASEAMNS